MGFCIEPLFGAAREHPLADPSKATETFKELVVLAPLHSSMPGEEHYLKASDVA